MMQYILVLFVIVLLFHVGFHRKNNRMNNAGKKAVLWCIDLCFSVLTLFLLISQYDFTPNKIEIMRFLWPVVVCILLAILLFGIGPSGFFFISKKKGREA